MDTVRGMWLRLAATLVIDYVSWTQLTILLTAFGLSFALLLAFLLIGNEEAGWNVVESVIEWIAQLPVLGSWFTTWMDSLAGDDGVINPSGKELASAVLKAWNLLSLAFMLLSLAVSWAFGPFELWSLKRKLGIAAILSLALLAGYITAYYIGQVQFNGPTLRWMLMFSGFGLLLFLVSVWCLTIAHVLGLLRRAIAQPSRVPAQHEQRGANA